jgi:tight adherence protein B
MNPLLLLLAAGAIFIAVFALLLIISKLVKPQEAVLAEGHRGLSPAPPVLEKDIALAHRLERAGIALPLKDFKRRGLLYALGAAFAGLSAGGFGLGGLFLGLLLALVAIKGQTFYIDWRFKRRVAEFVDQFSDALAVMSNGVKSGQTVVQTLETLVADFSDPLKGEVDEVLQELRMGVPLDECLARWAERLPCEDLEIATTALIVQRQTGGNIAEILDTLHQTIRERNKLYKQISALTAQGRMSGIVLAILPIGLFIVMDFIAPARCQLMFTQPLGLLMSAGGLLMIALGGYFIHRIVTIEV